MYYFFCFKENISYHRKVRIQKVWHTLFLFRLILHKSTEIVQIPKNKMKYPLQKRPLNARHTTHPGFLTIQTLSFAKISL